MTITEKIKTAFERNAKALSLRPAVGRGTAVTKVRVREGLTCDIEDGPWKITADMGEKHGGNNAGPNPGVFGRAAFGSCMAMGYIRWAAKLGVPVSNVEVEVQADYDARGEYGIPDTPVGYEEVRYVVTIESSAPEEEIMHVLDQADVHSPYFEIFKRGVQKLRREVKILETEV
ncbi:OsmC family protein [candidate division KSB1 bacterium]|nr:OsmC family protein [candidate division KSB1 bacterium]NIR73052.1 OsmC family protein [candidate division KSB1 bacterium]NIS26922.1 OsmC family protein [candidate division KSB1 bacterium]NIT73763.1 OsmC family protein [candidate division KSB1 bacterium]NIU27667.1 OsmC family protein [candidate division KSB1 bacterium]